MAQFKGTLTGSSGTVSRLGSKVNGASATVKGWGCGAEIHAHNVDGEDRIEVYANRGSNGGGEKFLGTITDGGKWTPAPQE